MSHIRQIQSYVQSPYASGLSDEEIARWCPSVFQTDKHESRSQRYAFISTGRLIQGLRAAGFVPEYAVQARAKEPGKQAFTRHLVRFRRADGNFLDTGSAKDIGLGGKVVGTVTLLNSHDGTSSYSLRAGLLRLACLNGMLVADDAAEELRIPHSGSAKVIDQVIEGSYEVLANSVRALTAAERWGRIPLSVDRQLAYAEQAHRLRFGETGGRSIHPGQLLAVRRPEDLGDDLWHTFQRVQENCVRGGLQGRAVRAGRPVRTTTKAVRGIGQDIALNRGLWHLTAETALAA